MPQCATISRPFLRSSLAFLSIPLRTTQVDVAIISRLSPATELPLLIEINEPHMFCFDIRPGLCCRSPSPANPETQPYANWVGIHNLLPSDIAAVWTNVEEGDAIQPTSGCSGRPTETRAGPFDE